MLGSILESYLQSLFLLFRHRLLDGWSITFLEDVDEKWFLNGLGDRWADALVRTLFRKSILGCILVTLWLPVAHLWLRSPFGSSLVPFWQLRVPFWTLGFRSFWFFLIQFYNPLLAPSYSFGSYVRSIFSCWTPIARDPFPRKICRLFRCDICRIIYYFASRPLPPWPRAELCRRQPR